MMLEIVAGLSAGLLFAIGGLHGYWAFGGKWGGDAAIPQHEGARAFTPGAGPTIIVALLLFAAGLILLKEAGVMEWAAPARYVRAGAWICAAAFALRVIGEFNYFGVFRRRRQTVFARMDAYLYTPLCAILSAVFVWAIL